MHFAQHLHFLCEERPVIWALVHPVQAVAENLFDAVKRQALLTESVIVSYSGGKESAVTLDLAARHFKTVHVFFMHQVAGLSFQEAVLK